MQSIHCHGPSTGLLGILHSITARYAPLRLRVPVRTDCNNLHLTGFVQLFRPPVTAPAQVISASVTVGVRHIVRLDAMHYASSPLWQNGCSSRRCDDEQSAARLVRVVTDEMRRA